MLIKVFRFIVRLVSAEYNNEIHAAGTVLKVKNVRSPALVHTSVRDVFGMKGKKLVKLL